MKTQGRRCLDGEMGWDEHWLVGAIPYVDKDTKPTACELCGKLSKQYNICGIGQYLHCIYHGDVPDGDRK